MNRLKGMIRDEPVHERLISMRTYPVAEERVIVEGRLRDDRLIEGYHWDGRRRAPDVVHWIYVRLLMGGWPLTIEDAEAEMPASPHAHCQEILGAVKAIIGVSIVSGFSVEINRRLGGIKGCAHMTHLILAMGSAALHGYWTQYYRRRRPVPRTLDELPALQNLINSCHLWAEDGELIKEIEATMKKERGASTDATTTNKPS
jgi:hypothetical protein